jgi:hypothetical protein
MTLRDTSHGERKRLRLNDVRRLPHLMLWQREIPGKFAEAVRVAAYSGPLDRFEQKTKGVMLGLPRFLGQ